MTETPACPTCGTPVPAGSPGGACPRCLLAAGLESGSAADRAAPPPPEAMARHFPQMEVLEVLGQGGMGIVYKARHRNLDRLVALKVLPPEAAREPGFPERFTREARTLARLQHPHIVGVHDFGETGGLYWLVMEFVDGPNLRQVLREGSLEPTQALAIVPQVCDALQYAHEQGIVHRDIKPENILLDRSGRVKIADFGLAKIVQRAPVDLTLTREGQVMGTLHYMAPEQYRAPDTVDHRADIYSLGVVFYEMLTGELPMGVFPPPSRKLGVDARLDGVVMRALEKEREQRWQHASDVRTRLDDIAAGPAAEETPDPTPGNAAPGGKRTRVQVGPLEVDVEKGPGGKTVRVAGIDIERARAAGAEVVEDGKGNIRLTFRKAWRDEDPAAPLSRLAVMGGLTIPIALLAALLVGAFLRMTGAGRHGTEAAFYLFLVLGLAGWIASLVAWGRIRRSGGTLRGRPWALAGVLATPLLVCCPGWFLFGNVVEPEIADDPRTGYLQGIRGDRMPPEAEVMARGRAEALSGGPVTMNSLQREYVVREMDDLWRAQGAGLLYQMYGNGEEGRIPSAWSVRFVSLAPDGWSGRVVASDGRNTIAFPVLHDGKQWTVPEGDREARPGGPGEGDRDGRITGDSRFRITRPGSPRLLEGALQGGPSTWTDADRAGAGASFQRFWSREGGSVLASAMPPQRYPGHDAPSADSLDVFLLYFDAGGHMARVVLTGPRDTIAFNAERSGDDWSVGLKRSGFVHAPRPAGPEWRDPKYGPPADPLPPDTGGGTPTPPDAALAADACLVHGLAPGRTAAELAAVARAVRALWKEKGPEYVRKPVPDGLGGGESRIPGNASDWTLFAVALDPEGRAGRAVFGNGASALSVPVERDGEVWVLGTGGWALRFSPPTKDDEDGELFR